MTGKRFRYCRIDDVETEQQLRGWVTARNTSIFLGCDVLCISLEISLKNVKDNVRKSQMWTIA